MKRLLVLFLAGLFCMIFTGTLPATENQTGDSPSIIVTEPRYEFSPVVDGRIVDHFFKVQNKGKSPLIIERVKTD